MIRISAAVIAVAALLGAAGTAAAGPCDKLAGARWVHYIDGGDPARAGVSVLDFRSGVVGATILATAGPTPFPPSNPSAPYGGSYIQQVTACTEEGNVATVIINVGASVLFTVAEDGESATTVGGQNLPGMTGWAVRDPTI
ncbi:hypothetical protein [Brevundimonas sp.]|uniref:hypothetical protein n=1 Tax=Brevundimonas sp. TaxID=1871086 RepID=UPI002D4A9E2C|nr:hypothetical protein [Brevundimonas sp.]HYC98778.1 hypothetical protein [Brevundimonas sp.]